MAKISKNELNLQNTIENTIRELDNFKDQMNAKPQPLHEDLIKLVSIITNTQNVLVEYEESEPQKTTKRIHVNPQLTKKITDLITLIMNKQERSGTLQLALNVLLNLQDTLRNIDVKNDIRLKRGLKVAEVEGEGEEPL